ncbi:MAG: dihydroorotate dehydrogenase electron transfer subunit [Patescibacteria group bacterium]|nr:dihydroorotate dehydrogenase electron transfer subunit [Patescibacteria group bacterium]MDD5715543.1 dihydroorotate dehydrogenase electron transfer subunit [Patescibacteria group bacterium]
MERPLGTIEQPRSLPIKKIVQENANVRTFYFATEMKAKPGQFVIMWIPRVDEKPFSVSVNEKGTLGLSIADVGRFTHKLFTLKVGDYVGIRGPYGSWFKLEPRAKRILLVGGGYGVAPLAYLAEQAKHAGIAVDFCIGARTKDLLMFEKRLRDLKATLHVATDDGSAGQRGFVTEAANACMEKNTYDSVYVCGPEMMEKKLVELCAGRTIPCQVSIERYMKCGFGICGQCCVDGSGARMCTEGPVVTGEYASKQTEFGSYHRTGSGMKQYYHGH